VLCQLSLLDLSENANTHVCIQPYLPGELLMTSDKFNPPSRSFLAYFFPSRCFTLQYYNTTICLTSKINLVLLSFIPLATAQWSAHRADRHCSPAPCHPHTYRGYTQTPHPDTIQILNRMSPSADPWEPHSSLAAGGMELHTQPRCEISELSGDYRSGFFRRKKYIYIGRWFPIISDICSSLKMAVEYSANCRGNTLCKSSTLHHNYMENTTKTE